MASTSGIAAVPFLNPIGDCQAIDRKNQRINEQIRISPIRVIGADGDQLGVIDTDEALQQARAVGLDLVEVAPQEKPPVCRIMDFGKFKYQQKKRQHKGHTHHSKNKELRLRPKIGDHDLMTKVNRAKEFLAEQGQGHLLGHLPRPRKRPRRRRLQAGRPARQRAGRRRQAGAEPADAGPADRGDLRAEVAAGADAIKLIQRASFGAPCRR